MFYLGKNDQDFSEERSVLTYVDLDSPSGIHTVALPRGVKAPLRIDMTNVPAAIRIESIQIVTKENSPQVRGFWSKHNSFEDVLIGENLIRIPNADAYQCIATNTDPYIYLQKFN